jgi:steroid delta-isomerase-like uncharacterized protein
MTRDEMIQIHDTHVAAEHAHDHEAAAATYNEDGYYEYVPLGIRFEGREAVALNYAAGNLATPDSRFEIDGVIADEEAETLFHWGTLHGTVTGEFIGQPPTGRILALPFVARFEFADGKMQGETIWFDLATLCDQAGFDLAAVQATATELAAALAPA